ncbi:hypothetical protein QFZ61_003302 [Arthrobacter sp. B3I4]|nr:hypothetical protein [Arthrobacter sp. B3I4]
MLISYLVAGILMMWALGGLAAGAPAVADVRDPAADLGRRHPAAGKEGRQEVGGQADCDAYKKGTRCWRRRFLCELWFRSKLTDTVLFSHG